jgi:hypothetical protein
VPCQWAAASVRPYRSPLSVPVRSLHRSLYVVLAATNEVYASGRIAITVGRADEPICAKETESLLPFAPGEEHTCQIHEAELDRPSNRSCKEPQRISLSPIAQYYLRLSSQSCANCARITVIINVAVSRTSCEGFSFGLHLDPLYLPAGAHLF